MTQSALYLSLTQFFMSLGFLLVFLATELGLAWALLYFRIRARRGASLPWMLAYRFWVRVFALALTLSFASSIPLVFQLGTLWPQLMAKIGEVAGPLVAAAVLSAFVFKSCFLGAMLYGQRKFSDAVHTLIVLMVALGTTLTSFWVIALIAWAQTPQGAILVDGRYRVLSWASILSAPSLPYLFALFFTGGLLMTAALMLGVTVARTVARPSDAGDRCVYATSLWLLLAGIVAQGALAAGLAQLILPLQPARAAAIAPQWHSSTQATVTLLAWPDSATQSNRWAWGGEGLQPDWLTRGPDGQYQGLDHFSGMAPPIGPTYLALRVVLIIGGLLVVLALFALWHGRRQRYEPDALSAVWRAILRSAFGLVCIVQLAGLAHGLWGALPYAVYGTMTLRELGTTEDAAKLAGMTVAYGLVYAFLLIGFWRLLRTITRYGVVPVARHRGRA
ncbi:cytochrome ubiquinol oxidase subunit I [Alcaligenaceae bacterium CGII-47]|nr:cytochrome ubiquinol oxidase subunit I [Alcaligenaceae bacterium CGII-47]